MNNQKQNRGRHRNNARRSNPSRQNFDSNGPGVRIRGNATQIYEKYIQLARDAQGSGDRVMAENMLQHAEHYYRILNDGNNGERPARMSHTDNNQGDAGSDGQDDTQDEAVTETIGATVQATGGNDGDNADADMSGNADQSSDEEQAPPRRSRSRGRPAASNDGGGKPAGAARGRGRRPSNRNADSAESGDEAPAQAELAMSLD